MNAACTIRPFYDDMEGADHEYRYGLCVWCGEVAEGVCVQCKDSGEAIVVGGAGMLPRLRPCPWCDDRA